MHQRELHYIPLNGHEGKEWVYNLLGENTGTLIWNVQSKANPHSLIKDSQHGFRQERSCLTNLLEFFEDITATTDKDNSVDGSIFRFSKALSKVPHQRLMTKT